VIYTDFEKAIVKVHTEVVPGCSGEHSRSVSLLRAPMSTSERLSPMACTWRILFTGMDASSGVSSNA